MSRYYSSETDSWGSTSTVSGDTTEWKEHPRAVFDGDGIATVSWYQYQDSAPWHTLIYANRYTPGSVWESETALISDSAYYDSAEPVSDDAGNLFVLYQSRDSDDSHSEIRVSRYSTVGGWGEPVLLHTNSVRKDEYPSIVLDNNGNALAVWSWRESGTSTGGIVYSRYLADGSWGAVQGLDNSGGYVYGTSLAVRSNGAAAVAWSQYDDTSGTKNILVNQFK